VVLQRRLRGDQARLAAELLRRTTLIAPVADRPEDERGDVHTDGLCRHGGEQVVEAFAQPGEDDVLLGREVPEERGRGDVGDRADVLDGGRIESPLGEEVQRRGLHGVTVRELLPLPAARRRIDLVRAAHRSSHLVPEPPGVSR
jgi:hypothetical protein